MKRSSRHRAAHDGAAALDVKTLIYKIRAFMGTPLARRLVLGLFVVQAVILVFTVKIGVPPDETNHTEFINYYANHSLSPIFTNQTPTYNLGDKTREVDYLYHYTMSLVMRVLPFSSAVDYHIIRLFSVVFGLLTLLALAKVFRRLGLSGATITVALLILTNLPMVLMMSSAINNDVFVWLGMVVEVLLLLRLWKRPSTTDVLWLADLSIIGGLVKRDLLPLGLLFGLLGLLVVGKNFRTIMTGFKRVNWRLCVAVIVLIVGLALFTERIGGNLVRYGGITPTCERVQGVAACYDFWGNVRARSLEQLPTEQPVPPAAFVVKWFGESFSNIVDVQTQGWHHTVRPVRWLTPLLAGMLIAGIGYGFVYEKKKFAFDTLSRQRVYVLGIALFYIFVQLAVNYANYKQVKVFGIALNGRYIIPSLLFLIGFACFYWSKILARYPKVVATVSLIVVLSTIFGSGLMLLLRNPQLFTGL